MLPPTPFSGLPVQPFCNSCCNQTRNDTNENLGYEVFLLTGRHRFAPMAFFLAQLYHPLSCTQPFFSRKSESWHLPFHMQTIPLSSFTYAVEYDFEPNSTT